MDRYRYQCDHCGRISKIDEKGRCVICGGDAWSSCKVCRGSGVVNDGNCPYCHPDYQLELPEGAVFELISRILTNGNAGTWDQLADAAVGNAEAKELADGLRAAAELLDPESS